MQMYSFISELLKQGFAQIETFYPENQAKLYRVPTHFIE